jgi:PAS domain S-box-containing protein
MSDHLQPDAFEWRQIVDGATDTAIISTNRDGEVTSWNRGAERILGWTEKEMIGLSLDRIFTAEGQQKREFDREIEDAISKGKGGG